ncbi:MAG: alpha-ketoacid dehydrogenase subunit beta, partial [Anaerolineae bacterium]|nr:alpha-ketoacid dehydrogenase subunit beta [Anaerolineae bacterium]
MAKMKFMEAIRETIRQEMAADPYLFLIGEDVGKYGGEQGVTGDLWYQFGDDRIRDAPIAEASIIGCALGAAMTGCRAIAEIPFGDFLGMCMDQIYNQAAKMRYMSGGQARVPLVIRTTMGGYISGAEQHSQCLPSWFVHVPGIKVVVPSMPDDAAGLLRAALRDDNPVIFFEHSELYPFVGEVPDDPDFVVPL